MDSNGLFAMFKRHHTEPRMIQVDTTRELFLVWFGGHGVHAYQSDGTEVSYWNVGDFANNNATPDEVLDSMRECIDTGEYP